MTKQDLNSHTIDLHWDINGNMILKQTVPYVNNANFEQLKKLYS